MKLIEMKCKNCGAKLNVDENSININCPYCNTTFKLDDEIQHIHYDNAEQSGYDFEKGRIRAQQEENNKRNFVCPMCNSRNVNIQIVNESYLKNVHHGLTWWLLIGWWWIPIKWIFLTLPALIFKIIGSNKRKKIINKTSKKAIC